MANWHNTPEVGIWEIVPLSLCRAYRTLRKANL